MKSDTWLIQSSWARTWCTPRQEVYVADWNRGSKQAEGLPAISEDLISDHPAFFSPQDVSQASKASSFNSASETPSKTVENHLEKGAAAAVLRVWLRRLHQLHLMLIWFQCHNRSCEITQRRIRSGKLPVVWRGERWSSPRGEREIPVGRLGSPGSSDGETGSEWRREWGER